MRVGDAKSYVHSKYSSPSDSFDGPMWSFGHEAWCNMKGRFVTIEADYSHLAG